MSSAQAAELSDRWHLLSSSWSHRQQDSRAHRPGKETEVEKDLGFTSVLLNMHISCLQLWKDIKKKPNKGSRVLAAEGFSSRRHSAAHLSSVSSAVCYCLMLLQMLSFKLFSIFSTDALAVSVPHASFPPLGEEERLGEAICILSFWLFTGQSSFIRYLTPFFQESLNQEYDSSDNIFLHLLKPVFLSQGSRHIS